MFKVKNITTGNIEQVLSVFCDEYGKAWFLFWVGKKWAWRPADNYCPPNYTPKKNVIVAGSRSFNNYQLVKETLDARKDSIEKIVSGCAKGADTLGETWAIKNEIPIKKFPAYWETYGAAAGYIRNHAMGDYADELIAFWDGISPGTKDMIDYMHSLGKPVEVIHF